MAGKSFKRAQHDRSSGKTRPRHPGGRSKGKGSPMAHDKGKGAHGGARSRGPGPRGMHTRGTKTGKQKGHGGGRSVAMPGGSHGRPMSTGAKRMGHPMMSGRGAQGAQVNEAKPGKRAGTKLGGERKMGSLEQRLQDKLL